MSDEGKILSVVLVAIVMFMFGTYIGRTQARESCSEYGYFVNNGLVTYCNEVRVLEEVIKRD